MNSDEYCVKGPVIEQEIIFCFSARKLRKFSKLKNIGNNPSSLQSEMTLSSVSPVAMPKITLHSAGGVQFTPTLVSILQIIEPEVVYAGYDNSQPDSSNYLLTSLNRLCERQLVAVVKWAKSVPGNSMCLSEKIPIIREHSAHYTVFVPLF